MLQKREILTDVLRTMINNPFKEIFYVKRKKKSNQYFDSFFHFP